MRAARGSGFETARPSSPRGPARAARDLAIATTNASLFDYVAVDEAGYPIAVLGRLASRPFRLEEMRQMFLGTDGQIWAARD